MKNTYEVAIIGGGITGLYCAYKLLKINPNLNVAVFERSERLGGRIETVKLGEFNAEFGPMRFEIPRKKNEKGGQELFYKLIKELGFEDDDLLPFPDYSTAPIDMSKYNLSESEKICKDAKELMKLGIFRLLKFYRLKYMKGNFDFQKISESNNNNKWLSSLNEKRYSHMKKNASYISDVELREYIYRERHGEGNDVEKRAGEKIGFKEIIGKIEPDIKLYQLGFWNALSYVLTNDAIKLIRDNGNFYHLLPENPNAIEWIIFWLRGFKPTDKLVKIKQGSHEIIRRIVVELRNKQKYPNFKIFTENEVESFSQLENNGTSIAKVNFINGQHIFANDVIITIPKAPLLKIGDSLKSVSNELDSVFGFPLLKCFYVVENPWWKEDTPVHTRASSIPAREIHYDKKGNLGIVLLYMDRPYSQYWSIYIKDKELNPHDEAEIYNSDGKRIRLIKDDQGNHQEERMFNRSDAPVLKSEFDKYLYAYNKEIWDLKFKLKKYIDSLNTINPNIRQESKREIEQIEAMFEKIEHDQASKKPKVIYYGIRDWGRSPYGAACHTWKPGAKSWEVLGRLSAFSLDNCRRKIFHICGEAYCDYNGFIEGSLRSSEKVLSYFK